MQKTTPILKFKGPYAFLSNFYPAVVEVSDLIYPSVEHAYQAAKFDDFYLKVRIAGLYTAGDAKKFAREFSDKINPLFFENRLLTMEMYLRQKFNIDPCKQLLIDTYPREIIEGNTWGDTFWGVCDGVGENNLGKLLMKIREELVNGIETTN